MHIAGVIANLEIDRPHSRLPGEPGGFGRFRLHDARPPSGHFLAYTRLIDDVAF